MTIEPCQRTLTATQVRIAVKDLREAGRIIKKNRTGSKYLSLEKDNALKSIDDWTNYEGHLFSATRLPGQESIEDIYSVRYHPELFVGLRFSILY